ncbi:MAG: cation:dicarboxylase symporter family transporter, partial [Blautia sp.]|nr:cation:dicarboxylase symporter family transporter [Blautia sp.]
MALTNKKLTLNEEAIELVSKDLQDYLSNLGTERRNIHRIRLTAEEMLLNILKNYPRGTEIQVGIGKQFGQQVFQLRYAGEAYDPSKYDDSWSDDLMRSLGYYPSWSYRNGVNRVSLVMGERPRRSAIQNILLAVVLAVILGLSGNLFPQTLQEDLNKVILSPLAEGFLGLMSTFSPIMIAFTICSGVLGIGNSMSLGKMGKQILLHFIGILFLFCLLTPALLDPFLDMDFSGGMEGGASQWEQISEMIFDILPKDFIAPFQTGNTLQVIVISLFAGVGLLVIGEREKAIRELIEEGASLTQHTVTFICGFIPLFVFAMLLRQVWFEDYAVLLSIWKPLVLIFLTETLLSVLFFLGTATHLHCPPQRLLKKTLPPFMVAFTTASSMSAMTVGMDSCKKLGIRSGIVSFAYPLGMVIYMPASIVSFATIVCTFAETYQVKVSYSWMIMMAITVTLLVIAMPPIPGAGLLVYTILFTRMGIPAQALVMATAVDVVVDFCNTGFN